MAQLKLNKNNFIDLVTAVVVILIFLILGLYYLNKPTAETTKLNVIVEVSDTSQIQIIPNQAEKDKLVYLNSINVPINVLNVDNQAGRLEINLQGPGHVDKNGFYFFGGQRLVIGQKAEIHANYFAQGKIVAIENAN